MDDFCEDFRASRIRYTRHYLDQILERDQPDRADLRFMVCDDDPEAIEYNSDGTSLIWGMASTGRIGHALFTGSPRAVVVTAYWPDSQPQKWTKEFKERTGRS